MLNLYQNAIWLISVGCQIVLLARLWRFGMISRYRWFVIFLALQVVQTGALFPFDKFSETYAYLYLGGSILILVAAVFVVLELYGMVLKDYSGIGSLGRWVITGGMGVAVLISIVTLSPDLSNSADQYPRLLQFAILQRAVYSALLVFILIISGFLAWFPIPLSRNTVRHTLLFTVMFSSTAVLLLVRNTMGYADSPYYLLSAIEMTVHLLCLLAWIAFLRPQGESKTVVVGHRWQPGQSGRLVGQLDAINSSLLRTARNNPPK